jgi:hypothetical protein
MKKIVILLVALTLSTFIMAQEKTKVKEIGLTFRNLDQFGFSYKVGTEHSLWRFNAISLSGNSESENLDNDDNDRDSNHFGLGFSVGKEYRKLIAKNFEYRYGFDFSFSYKHSKIKRPSYSEYVSHYGDITSKSNIYTPGINLVLGVNYIISEHLVLGAEMMPYFKYTFGKRSEEMEEYYDGEIEIDHSNFRYGFNSSSILLSVAYRF